MCMCVNVLAEFVCLCVYMRVRRVYVVEVHIWREDVRYHSPNRLQCSDSCRIMIQHIMNGVYECISFVCSMIHDVPNGLYLCITFVYIMNIEYAVMSVEKRYATISPQRRRRRGKRKKTTQHERHRHKFSQDENIHECIVSKGKQTRLQWNGNTNKDYHEIAELPLIQRENVQFSITTGCSTSTTGDEA